MIIRGTVGCPSQGIIGEGKRHGSCCIILIKRGQNHVWPVLSGSFGSNDPVSAPLAPGWQAQWLSTTDLLSHPSHRPQHGPRTLAGRTRLDGPPTWPSTEWWRFVCQLSSGTIRIRSSWPNTLTALPVANDVPQGDWPVGYSLSGYARRIVGLSSNDSNDTIGRGAPSVANNPHCNKS